MINEYGNYLELPLEDYSDQTEEVYELMEMNGEFELDSSLTKDAHDIQGDDIHREKREITNRLQDYRKTNGLGSIARLARAAGVRESELRRILDAAPMPYDTWKKVKQGLDILENAAPAPRNDE